MSARMDSGLIVFIVWRGLIVLFVGLTLMFRFNFLMEAIPSCLEDSVKAVEVASVKLVEVPSVKLVEVSDI